MSEAARSGFEHQQEVTVDYRPGIVREVLEGPAPVLALDVTIAWPDSGHAPSSLTYKDTLSVPRVEVHDTACSISSWSRSGHGALRRDRGTR